MERSRCDVIWQVYTGVAWRRVLVCSSHRVSGSAAVQDFRFIVRDCVSFLLLFVSGPWCLHTESPFFFLWGMTYPVIIRTCVLKSNILRRILLGAWEKIDKLSLKLESR